MRGKPDYKPDYQGRVYYLIDSEGWIAPDHPLRAVREMAPATPGIHHIHHIPWLPGVDGAPHTCGSNAREPPAAAVHVLDDCMAPAGDTCSTCVAWQRR
jgi:hypothetical protein